jgi:hypothetical protein
MVAGVNCGLKISKFNYDRIKMPTFTAFDFKIKDGNDAYIMTAIRESQKVYIFRASL